MLLSSLLNTPTNEAVGGNTPIGTFREFALPSTITRKGVLLNDDDSPIVDASDGIYVRPGLNYPLSDLNLGYTFGSYVYTNFYSTSTNCTHSAMNEENGVILSLFASGTTVRVFCKYDEYSPDIERPSITLPPNYNAYRFLCVKNTWVIAPSYAITTEKHIYISKDDGLTWEIIAIPSSSTQAYFMSVWVMELEGKVHITDHYTQEVHVFDTETKTFTTIPNTLTYNIDSPNLVRINSSYYCNYNTGTKKLTIYNATHNIVKELSLPGSSNPTNIIACAQNNKGEFVFLLCVNTATAYQDYACVIHYKGVGDGYDFYEKAGNHLPSFSGASLGTGIVSFTEEGDIACISAFSPNLPSLVINFHVVKYTQTGGKLAGVKGNMSSGHISNLIGSTYMPQFTYVPYLDKYVITRKGNSAYHSIGTTSAYTALAINPPVPVGKGGKVKVLSDYLYINTPVISEAIFVSTAGVLVKVGDHV